MINKSESIQALASSLLTFHAEMDVVYKTADNPFFHSKYVPLSTILAAIKEPLAKAGLSFVQFPSGLNQLTTVLMDATSGEYIEATYEMTPSKNDPQGQGSVITYQRRYALSAILGINADEDDDGNAASATPKSGGVEGVTPWKTPIKTPAALKDLSAREVLITAANNVIKDPQDSERVAMTIEKIKANKELTDEDRDNLIPQLSTILDEMNEGTWVNPNRKGVAKI